jgi:hypothetical protein
MLECPLCEAAITYHYTPLWPATWTYPAEGDEFEFYPECDCATARCVDEDKYYQWLDEIARAAGHDLPWEREYEGD